ncbi:hypothetical protein CC1G_01390 [Coprinopsis cinerea okayama7|uniref:RRM domain-containing protein n=1 Tax=Coprinopsis cinerea (strain Okayama-7 / 130 / ATCC MYA-4618 / FGSC 9003) TaxID=240176 RepID=A8NYN7_COPC7|nr:hypothetical protein CC1G_01390 [Coprinopsis cinerea okayama7\|eukprot:XP_001837478.1 hypothetical protein CC1G_01390 [Coprinopsis cinerea okayama7\
MEEGAKSKKTVFIGGISDDTDEALIYETFSTFGDILEVQIPPPQNTNHPQPTDPKHRGFAFVTFSSPADAQDAIDNMDMNELRGRVLKVTLAKPTKAILQPDGNRAVWESEEWLKQYVKPLDQSGGSKLQSRGRSQSEGAEDAEEAKEDEDAMQE